MFHWMYGIWMLFPLSFLVMAGYASSKKWFKIPGREYPSEYLKQGFYCVLGLLLAIGFDKVIYPVIVDMLVLDSAAENVFRFLIYPGVLLCMAQFQRLSSGEDKERVLAASKSHHWSNR